MKKLIILCFLAFVFLCVNAQNPKIVTTVSGTSFYPNNTSQADWANNKWNGMIFYASNGLSVTDGTATGTKFLASVGSGTIQRILPAKDFVYIFTAQLITPSPYTFRYQIYKSDGTTAGTSLITTLPDAVGISNLNQFCSDGSSIYNYSLDGTTNTMYFGAYDATNGNELWVTDGTAVGTHIVKDLKVGTGGSNPWGFIKIGNEVFFNCNEIGFEKKLWKTDGTEAGTVKVNVAEPFYIVNGNIGKLGNKMLFYAHNTVDGYEPYVSDGTATGTFMLKNINPSGNSLLATAQEMHLKSNSNYSFFIANNGTDTTLWRTDGTSNGTIRLTPNGVTFKNNVSSGGYSDIDESGLWMVEFNASGASEKIYKSDGTLQGTYMAAENISYGQKVKIYKNALWMQARNIGSNANTEPWRCAGNQATTNIAFEIRPENSGTPVFAPFSSDPFGFFVNNNKLYFFATRNSGPTVNLYEYTGDFTFNGSVVGGSWRDSANWNSMMPPGITDTVFINAGTPNALNIIGANAYAGVLQLGNNATLNLTNTTDSIFVNTSLTNGTNNNFSGNGSLVFRNSTNSNAVEINNSFTANNVVVQSNSNVNTGNITINNRLNLTNGNLTLNNNNVTLTGTTSTATGSSSSYVVTNGLGRMTVQNIGTGARTGAVNFPIGTAANYNPIIFTNTGAADNFSARVQPNINSAYTTETPSGANFGTRSVDATWFITEATAGGSNTTIGLQWNASQELMSFDRNTSQFGHYNSGAWLLQAATAASGSNPYTLTGIGITSFSPFGVMNGGVLPNKSLHLSIQKNNNSYHLSWVAQDVEIENFEIEKSYNGVMYYKLNQVGKTEKAFTDVASANSTKTYYRLKAINKQGSFYYSNVVFLSNNLQPIQVYPTVFTTQFAIQNNTDNATLQLFNAYGSLVLQQLANKGTTIVLANNLANGTYWYKLINATNTLQQGSLIKQ